ncbi:tRNA-specific adenosine deaminase subunit tad3 [Ascosphaera acerosa]|nr:tRNA-specific adenosine deaminase subunit tad3 [Ascosphaera acerosa]
MSIDSVRPLKGTVVSLKTVQETRAADNLGQTELTVSLTQAPADAYVAEIDIKCANRAIKALDTKFPQDATTSLSHLRRFARGDHLPDSLRLQAAPDGTYLAPCIYLLVPPPLPDVARLRNVLAPFAPRPVPATAPAPAAGGAAAADSTATLAAVEAAAPASGTDHETGKRKRSDESDGAAPAVTTDAHVTATSTSTMTVAATATTTAAVGATETPSSMGSSQDSVRLLRTRISLNPPTSLAQAQTWSRTLWPTQFNAAAQPATHSPPPPLLAQIRQSVQPRAGYYLALAQLLAQDAEGTTGRGRPVGVVLVDPDVSTPEDSEGRPWTACVAAAGDARYWQPADAVADTAEGAAGGCDGHPSRHAVMRAIAMVANKRLRTEASASATATAQAVVAPVAASPPQQPQAAPSPVEAPLSALEEQCGSFAPPPSYLCTNLDAYITHEPCLMCAMGLLLSRFRSVTFLRPTAREDAAFDPHVGYGLHWRRELNWRAVTFQFISEEHPPEEDQGRMASEAAFNA